MKIHKPKITHQFVFLLTDDQRNFILKKSKEYNKSMSWVMRQIIEKEMLVDEIIKGEE